MIHELTLGHLDRDSLNRRVALAVRPLEEDAIDRVLAEFPGLAIERRAGSLIVPWHGRGDAARGEAFARRLQAETGCLVADRRNGRIVDLGREEGMAKTA